MDFSIASHIFNKSFYATLPDHGQRIISQRIRKKNNHKGTGTQS
jgi:hypothetical protein